MAIVLNDITSGYNLSKINANFQNIEDYINDKLLARADTGVAGEAMMERDLDMNGNEILNYPVDVTDPTSLVTKAYVDAGDAALQLQVNRTLRFPEEVAQMSPVGARANSLQGYNSAGNPVPIFSMTDTADLAIKLASNEEGLGASLVGLQQAGTVQQAITYLTPEMFSSSVVDGDWAPAINAAQAAAISAGLDRVIGEGVYTLKSQVTLQSGVHASPSGGSIRQGISLELNVVIIDTNSWDEVPAKFWEAKAAFIPPVGKAVENVYLGINQFDGGGRATAVATTGGAISTSHIHISNLRNHIIGYKNFLDMNTQSGMNKITGQLWQGGYIATLIGGKPNGGGNSECHHVNINWCATHRYGGISLQDRSQYANITGGTYDYNGKWLTMLTITNPSATTNYVINFGDEVTDGTITGYAMSNLMNYDGTWIVFVSDTQEAHGGTSRWASSGTLTNNTTGWTGTISGNTTTSSSSVRYFDIILSNMTGGFSKCHVTPDYLGGVYGHYLFTNHIWIPNSVAVISAMNYRGLSIGGSVSTSNWYMRHLYGNSAFMTLDSSGINFAQPVQLGNAPITGRKNTLAMTNGVSASVFTFVAAESETGNRTYILTVSANSTAIGGFAIVRVGVSGITILFSNLTYCTLSSSGLTLYASINGVASANVTFNAQRQY